MKYMDPVRLSKRMSYALRHHPEEFGLVLAEDGSVPIKELASVLRCSLDDIESVLTMPGKKRYAVEGDRIRAYYGHSTEQVIQHEEIEPPDLLYHATSHRALPKIRKEGLSPMNRQFVHLSSTRETALVAGRRRDSDPPLLQVRAHDAWEHGVHFYRGNEDIVLSDPIPPEFIF